MQGIRSVLIELDLRMAALLPTCLGSTPYTEHGPLRRKASFLCIWYENGIPV